MARRKNAAPLTMQTLYVPPSLNANVTPTRDYGVELRIGTGPWYSTGVLCETGETAESVGAMFAKFWLGKAESRVVSPKQESESPSEDGELDDVDRAELHREYADNIAVNHN